MTEEKRIRVLYPIGDFSGSTYYRLINPITAAKRAGALGAIPVKFNEEPPENLFEQTDLYAIAHPDEAVYLKMIELAHTMGKKVVVDWDDDVFHVSPLTHQYNRFGTEDVTIEQDGKPVELWKDGKTFNKQNRTTFSIARNRERLENVKKICEMADLVTVTTAALAEVYLEFSPVTVLPNCPDMRFWKKLPFVPRMDEIRVGWFGGDTHYQDWCVMFPALARAMAKYPQLKLVIMGQLFSGYLKDIPPERIEVHPWVHFEAYSYKAAILDLDFAVIPLADMGFNYGKSPIKWIEMAALRVPAITSYIGPYREMMDIVPENGIFIDDNDPEAWQQAIDVMVEEREFREAMGRQAHRSVRERFDINVQYPLWVKAYEEVLRGDPVQSNAR